MSVDSKGNLYVGEGIHRAGVCSVSCRNKPWVTAHKVDLDIGPVHWI